MLKHLRVSVLMSAIYTEVHLKKIRWTGGWTDGHIDKRNIVIY